MTGATTRRDRGRLVPQLLGWGPTMYWSPNFLAVVVVCSNTRPREPANKHSSHKNAGFSILIFEIFSGGVIPPDPHRGRGNPFPHATPVGTQTLVLQLFSRGCPSPPLCRVTLTSVLCWSRSNFDVMVSLKSQLSELCSVEFTLSIVCDDNRVNQR